MPWLMVTVPRTKRPPPQESLAHILAVRAGLIWWQEPWTPPLRHSAHSCHAHDPPLQTYHHSREYSVPMMKMKNPLQTPHHKWIRWQALSTTSPPSSNVMSTILTCYIQKCPTSEGLKMNSAGLIIYSWTTCDPINTGLRKRTNYTTCKVRWETKSSSFGNHWGLIQKPPSEMYFSNSDKKLLGKISKKSRNKNWTS